MDNTIKIKELSDRFNEFSKRPDFDEYMSLYLLNTRSDPTAIYEVETDKEIKETLFDIISSQYDSKRFQDKVIEAYDPVMMKSDTHQHLLANQYDSIWTVVNLLINKSQINHTSKGVLVEHFSDYMVEFSIDSETYHAFGSVASVAKMKKFGVFGNLTNNKLKSINKDGVVGLNRQIDVLVIGKQDILIHGSQGFERVFELKNLFSEEAKQTLNSSDFRKYITKDVLDNLRKIVDNGGRIARRLTKLRNDEERLEDFFANIDKLTQIVGNPQHKNFKKFDAVTYEPKSQKLSVPAGKEEQLLNIITDANYRAEVSGHIGYDEGR